MPLVVDRRRFLTTAVSGAGAFCLPPSATTLAAPVAPRPSYRGPNVIIVRFGGGVRRRETIDPEETYSPFMLHELGKRGTLFPDLRISTEHGVETGHGQGTLNILTGRYDQYKDVDDRFLGERFEASVPTLFEYLRKDYSVAPHEALIINGEDRTDEEFYSFSNHHLFGVSYGCRVLSLYRFKTFLLRQQLNSGKLTGRQQQEKQKLLSQLESLDYRRSELDQQSGPDQAIERFWGKWRQQYGDSGLKNPRGDRLLTELAVDAIHRLRPRLLMINYNDPDYVHWGKLHHYTRAIAIIDEGLKRLVSVCDADPAYRDNTIFAIVPDCGRDSNPFQSVPCQHHFNSKSSRELFALLFGPGIEAGQVVDKPKQQISIAPTLAQAMGLKATFTEGDVLEEALA